MKSDALAQALAECKTLQDRATLYAAVMGFLEVCVGPELFNIKVKEAVDWLKSRPDVTVK